MAELQNNVALVFSASGISGWAVTKNLLSYPSKTTFSRVIALTHQPRTVEDSGLPKDPRLELYSGINLCLDLQNIKQQMHSIIPDLNKVTHVYYLGMSTTAIKGRTNRIKHTPIQQPTRRMSWLLKTLTLT